MWNRTWRWFIHLFVGIGNSVVFDINAHKGWAVFIGFMLFYEINEDYHIKDGAYKDVCGYLWGFILASICSWFLI